MVPFLPMRSIVVCALALVFAGPVVAGPAPVPAPAPPTKLEVHFIDVGQGDALLVRTPSGKTVLVDAGNVDAGEAVNDYLARLGVGELDLAMVSHPHLDHMGGMLEVLKAHRPASYIDPGYAHPLEAYDTLLDWLEHEEIPVRTARGGRTITLEPGITLELLAPDEPLLEGTRSDANSNSIVARLNHGKLSFLLTGDAEHETEERVMQTHSEIESTVLKVAHHGGKYSTTEAWLARVQPQFAIISCGMFNGYGHPSKETLGRLEARGVKVFQTRKDGDVIARSDGKTLQWETTGERSAKLDEPGGRRSLNTSGRREERDEHAPEPVAAAPIDVNTADADTLTKLPGVGRSLADAIVADRKANGPYADLAALQRIRGIGPALVDRLDGKAIASATATPKSAPVAVAVVTPAPTPPPAGAKAPRPSASPGTAFRVTARTQAALAAAGSNDETSTGRLFAAPRRSRVNVNLVDAIGLARASDISLDQARRIVEDRAKRGPFHSVEELGRVEGLGVAERAAVAKLCSVRIELNRATEGDLVALGLPRVEALAIVDHRRTAGRFVSIDDLEYIDALSPKNRARVLPLLTVDRSTGWN